MNNRRANGNSRKRSGLSLIELMGTMSVLLVIALAGTSMLATVTNIGVENKDRNQVRVDIARLATLFRADVHAADSIAVDDQSIELKFGDEVVRYQIDLQLAGINRERTGSDGRLSLDRFKIARQCRPNFDVNDDHVALRITEQDAGEPWIIEAARP